MYQQTLTVLSHNFEFITYVLFLNKYFARNYDERRERINILVTGTVGTRLEEERYLVRPVPVVQVGPCRKPVRVKGVWA